MGTARPGSAFKSPVPVDEATAQLDKVRFHLKSACPNGDCFPLSQGAGFEMTVKEAESPNQETQLRVVEVRNAAIDLVTGDKPIGGVSAGTVRALESLPADGAKAAEELKNWRKAGHWKEQGGSFAFMFGIAAATKRPTIALEESEGGILDPAMLYGERGDD